MSSTISTVEQKTVPSKAVKDLKMDHRLVRASSIEKIKRFNTFICSQQYYILPGILSWFKSSHSSAEMTIFIFRSIFFGSFISKLLSCGHDPSGAWTIQMFFGNLQSATNSLVWNFYKKFSKCFESTLLLAGAVYAACWLILAQLLFSIYLIYYTLVPVGFIFLVGCMLTIKYLCYKTLFAATSPKRSMKLKCK